jgi:hypothetical protein
MKLVEKSRLKAFKVDKILLENSSKIIYVGYIPRTWDISQLFAFGAYGTSAQ